MDSGVLAKQIWDKSQKKHVCVYSRGIQYAFHLPLLPSVSAYRWTVSRTFQLLLKCAKQ